MVARMPTSGAGSRGAGRAARAPGVAPQATNAASDPPDVEAPRIVRPTVVLNCNGICISGPNGVQTPNEGEASGADGAFDGVPP